MTNMKRVWNIVDKQNLLLNNIVCNVYIDRHNIKNII